MDHFIANLQASEPPVHTVNTLGIKFWMFHSQWSQQNTDNLEGECADR